MNWFPSTKQDGTSSVSKSFRPANRAPLGLFRGSQSRSPSVQLNKDQSRIVRRVEELFPRELTPRYNGEHDQPRVNFGLPRTQSHNPRVYNACHAPGHINRWSTTGQSSFSAMSEENSPLLQPGSFPISPRKIGSGRDSSHHHNECAPVKATGAIIRIGTINSAGRPFFPSVWEGSTCYRGTLQAIGTSSLKVLLIKPLCGYMTIRGQLLTGMVRAGC